MENVKLDLIPGRVMPICHASQYDVGRVIRFNLVENDVPYVLDGTETVTFGERKIDGNVITAACVVTATKSYVDLETTEQMCACYGQNLCELKIEKGSDIIGTLNFVLDVERDPLDGGIQSESEIYNLQVQVTEMANAAVAEAMSDYDIYGAYVTEDASGAIASFTDGADNVPVKALSVEFSASQASGTPTPSAPIPIVGVDKVNVTRTGKNLFNKTATDTTKGYITGYYLLSNGNTNQGSAWNVSEYIKVNPNDKFVVSGISGNSPAICFYNSNKEYISGTAYNGSSSVAVTTPNNCFYIRISYNDSTIDTVQFELGTTATAYEPYNGTTALINLGGTYYGGSVDAVTGKITKQIDTYTITGEETSVQILQGTNNNGYRIGILLANSTNKYSGLLSSVAKNANVLGSATWGIGNFCTYSGRLYITVPNEYDTVAKALQYLAGGVFEYELATPIVVYASNTIILNTLLGDNNIFSDAGDVDVTYRADTALYIDKRLNA